MDRRRSESYVGCKMLVAKLGFKHLSLSFFRTRFLSTATVQRFLSIPVVNV